MHPVKLEARVQMPVFSKACGELLGLDLRYGTERACTAIHAVQVASIHPPAALLKLHVVVAMGVVVSVCL